MFWKNTTSRQDETFCKRHLSTIHLDCRKQQKTTLQGFKLINFESTPRVFPFLAKNFQTGWDWAKSDRCLIIQTICHSTQNQIQCSRFDIIQNWNSKTNETGWCPDKHSVDALCCLCCHMLHYDSWCCDMMWWAARLAAILLRQQ